MFEHTLTKILLFFKCKCLWPISPECFSDFKGSLVVNKLRIRAFLDLKKIIFLAINYYLLKKTPKYFGFKILTFFYIFIQGSSSYGD